MKKLTLLIVLGLFVFINNTNAQFLNEKDTNKVDYNHWFLTGVGGVMQFYGDISSDVYFPGSSKKGEFNPFFNIKGGYNFNQYFGLQGAVLMGSMWSEDDKSLDYFHANIRDYQLEAHINLTSVFAPKRYNKKWHAFMNLGVGFMQYRTILYDKNDNIINAFGYDITSPTTADKASMEWQRLYSLGWGARYRISHRWDIGVDVNLRKPPVDKIDAKDASVQPLLVYSEYDRYSYAGLSLTYTFGSKSDMWQWNPKDPELNALYDAIRRQKNNADTLNKEIAALKKCKCEVDDPNDDDQDGVPNSRDLEPNTPKPSIVNFQGIRIPIFDTTGLNMDITNLGKGGKGRSGVSGGADPGMYFMSVYFPFDQTTIDAENYQRIVMIATYMMRHPDVKIRVSGNCDIRGTNQYNDDLAVRRSKAVIKILKKDFKIDESRLVIEGLSEYKPISPVTHSVNRRVDFFIVE